MDQNFITLDADDGDPNNDADGWYCTSLKEASGSIKIQNGRVTESFCMIRGIFELKNCVDFLPVKFL